MRRHAAIIVLLIAAAACGRTSSQPPASPAADARVRALADAYVDGFFQQFPEQATQYSLTDRPHDRLTDNSRDALAQWEAKEDQWLKEVAAIDLATVESRSMRATYAILRETLEASIGQRVCRTELWNVSQMTGWQVSLGYLVTIQPTGSDKARQEAAARWGRLSSYLDTEIGNLREGIASGYTAPKHIVRIVITQARQLAAMPYAQSPFYAPALADQDPAFQAEMKTIVEDEINPAIRTYANFLEREYLPAAREAIAVSANTDGAACYTASVRTNSTLPKSAQEVHDTGLREVARIDAEMKAIAERSFGTSDVPALMQRLRTDRQYTFKTRDEIVQYSQAALARARAAMPQWFGIVPKTDVRIEPYPAFREVSGAPGEYHQPSADGSRPGLFYINTSEPQNTTRADQESTAFHEMIPGHHMQIAIAMEQQGAHPLAKYIGNNGYQEGWGLYAEQLADEMKLFSGDLDRLGMLASQNLRAARLVVDSGLHALGWTRQQAIDYMLAHTPMSPAAAASEVDRYIIWPGQATGYMLGRLEIVAAREEARQTAGSRFDIKAFHDRILEDGAVPLTYLRAKIRAAFASS